MKVTSNFDTSAFRTGKTVVSVSTISSNRKTVISQSASNLLNTFPDLAMAGGKRPLAVKAKATKETAVEDKETPFGKMEEMDERSDDDDDTSDSSVYSELEGEKSKLIPLKLGSFCIC